MSNITEWRAVSAEFLGPVECVGAKFAFVGRSNVGKSSLINAIVERNKLARQSKTPGRTQEIHHYRLEFKRGKEEELSVVFVDLPGFGYAKVSKGIKRTWSKMIGDYLGDFSHLQTLLLLVDARRELGDEERWFLEVVPADKLCVVVTKCDKLSSSELQRMKQKFRKEFPKLASSGAMAFVSTMANKKRYQGPDGKVEVRVEKPGIRELKGRLLDSLISGSDFL